MKAFVDTNVVVYAHDSASGRKKDQARELLRRLAAEENGVVSVQVFLEFAAVAVNKLKFSHQDTMKVLAGMGEWECVRPDWEMVIDAVHCASQEKLSLWDAMVIVAALRARCGILYTEDLNPGQIIRGLKIANPFAEAECVAGKQPR